MQALARRIPAGCLLRFLVRSHRNCGNVKAYPHSGKGRSVGNDLATDGRGGDAPELYGGPRLLAAGQCAFCYHPELWLEYASSADCKLGYASAEDAPKLDFQMNQPFDIPPERREGTLESTEWVAQLVLAAMMSTP